MQFRDILRIDRKIGISECKISYIHIYIYLYSYACTHYLCTLESMHSRNIVRINRKLGVSECKISYMYLYVYIYIFMYIYSYIYNYYMCTWKRMRFRDIWRINREIGITECTIIIDTSMHMYIISIYYLCTSRLKSLEKVAFSMTSFVAGLRIDRVNVTWQLQSAASPCMCVAVCCSVLQCVAVCCSVLQCVAVCLAAGSTSRGSSSPLLAPVCVLQCVAVCCSMLQCVVVCHTHSSSSLPQAPACGGYMYIVFGVHVGLCCGYVGLFCGYHMATPICC